MSIDRTSVNPSPTGPGGPTGPSGPTGPAGSSFTYTNATPMPQDVGGFDAGTTFSAETLQQMFDGLLYPYQAPTFTSFQITGYSNPREVGDSITGTQTFTWGTSNPGNVSPNTVEIRDITNAVDLGTGLADDGSESLDVLGPIQKLSQDSHQWRIRATNTNLATFQRILTINWLWLRFWGSDPNAVLNGTQINFLEQGGLSSSIAGSYVFNEPGGEYRYFAWADSLPAASSFTDQSTGFNVPMADSSDNAAYSNTANGLSYALVSVTNSFSVTTNYKLYRTKNTLGASPITIVVA